MFHFSSKAKIIPFRGKKGGLMPLIVIMQAQGMTVIRTNKNDKSLENSIHSLEAKRFLKYEENKLQHEIHANSLLIIWKDIHVTNIQVQQGLMKVFRRDATDCHGRANVLNWNYLYM